MGVIFFVPCFFLDPLPIGELGSVFVPWPCCGFRLLQCGARALAPTLFRCDAWCLFYGQLVF